MAYRRTPAHLRINLHPSAYSYQLPWVVVAAAEHEKQKQSLHAALIFSQS
jgi:hypothetical protein